MKSSREHEDEGYLSVRESGESARLPAPQAAVILLSTIVARGGSNRHAQHGAREAAASVPPAQGSLPVAAGAAWPAPSAAGGAIRPCGSWQERRPLWDASMSNMNISSQIGGERLGTLRPAVRRFASPAPCRRQGASGALSPTAGGSRGARAVGQGPTPPAARAGSQV